MMAVVLEILIKEENAPAQLTRHCGAACLRPHQWVVVGCTTPSICWGLLKLKTMALVGWSVKSCLICVYDVSRSGFLLRFVLSTYLLLSSRIEGTKSTPLDISQLNMHSWHTSIVSRNSLNSTYKYWAAWSMTRSGLFCWRQPLL